MFLKNKIKSADFLRFLVVLIISLTASYTIIYTSIHFFSDSNPGGNDDALSYLSMYRGEQVDDIHWPSRVLIPFLARCLPNPPEWLFQINRNLSDSWLATVKFGIVNFFFLVATGIIFFYFLISLDLSISESLIGILLFYVSRPVVHSAGMPMAEAAGYFFLLLCWYAIQRQNLIMLAIGFLIGMFAKETIFLVFPIILVSPFKYKIRVISLLILGTIIYYILRCFGIYNINDIKLYLNMRLLADNFKYVLLSMTRFNKIIDLFSSFGILWIPALYALMRPDTPLLLHLWSYSIVIMLMVIFLGALDLGRILFCVFPVVIPLALYGMRYMLRNGRQFYFR
ncbi:MAG: hypothetical protein Q8R31_02895 [Candidatus Omnitrophota bacterium]|nr:hypothetical protein [Candidatus Omnitrophota bacterium]